MNAVVKNAFAKFDETVDVAMRLGVDPKHADQMVRGTVVLPHGLGGKAKRVAVIAAGDKLKEAQAAGADFVGGEDLVARIQNENWLDFDALVATPDMMRSVGKLGKVLGPRGLMPNPKTGTVTTDVAKAIKEIKAGKVEYRVDKNGVVHAPCGKVSFGDSKLTENIRALAESVMKAKPPAAKGKYVRSVTISSTMGPGRSGRSRLHRSAGVAMALKRKEKEAFVQSLRSGFAKSQHAILVDFRGISVPAVTEFRRKIRQSGGSYKVIKNTLAVRALEGTPLASLKDKFLETTAIAYCETDPVALAKVVVDFSKDHPQIVVKSGLVSGTQMLDANGVKALSTMPGLPELRSMLLGVLQAPSAKLVRLLNTPAQQMVRVLKAHEDSMAEKPS